MTEKFVALTTIVNYNHPTYHLKTDYPQINFSNFNEKRDFNFSAKDSNDPNYSQVKVLTSYTVSINDSEHFCRFDVESNFETNKNISNYTKDNFKKLLQEYHIKNVKTYVDGKELTFPNQFIHILKFDSIDVNSISKTFADSL